MHIFFSLRDLIPLTEVRRTQSDYFVQQKSQMVHQMTHLMGAYKQPEAETLD